MAWRDTLWIEGRESERTVGNGLARCGSRPSPAPRPGPLPIVDRQDHRVPVGSVHGWRWRVPTSSVPAEMVPARKLRLRVLDGGDDGFGLRHIAHASSCSGLPCVQAGGKGRLRSVSQILDEHVEPPEKPTATVHGDG